MLEQDALGTEIAVRNRTRIFVLSHWESLVIASHYFDMRFRRVKFPFAVFSWWQVWIHWSIAHSHVWSNLVLSPFLDRFLFGTLLVSKSCSRFSCFWLKLTWWEQIPLTQRWLAATFLGLLLIMISSCSCGYSCSRLSHLGCVVRLLGGNDCSIIFVGAWKIRHFKGRWNNKW